jgi:phage replication-related protein YjqB (UPF0714/DUF867 family)
VLRLWIPSVDVTNLCNRGRSNAGVQLELSKAVRRTMFESLKPEGRIHTTARFDAFVAALRETLGAAPIRR